ANVVRLTVGESVAEARRERASQAETIAHDPHFATATTEDTVSVFEANLDDLNPQVFGYLMDRLLNEGALDVFGIPVQMKKSRPGLLLTVLSRTEDTDRLMEIIFAETTTLGIRRREEKRQVLGRKWIPVATKWGDVRIKVASRNGSVTNYAPEYEDCRRIASERRVPLKEVMQEAMRMYAEVQDETSNRWKDRQG